MDLQSLYVAEPGLGKGEMSDLRGEETVDCS
jgi:hypothetical protein